MENIEKRVPVLLLVFSSFIFATTSLYGQTDKEELIGRWNLHVDMDGKNAPSWLEVKLSGYSTLVGYFVGDNGSARPISEIQFDKGNFSFEIPAQWEDTDKNLKLEGQLSGRKINGKIHHPLGNVYSFEGVEAPLLERDQEPSWGEAVEIFNGKDLTGWYPDADENQWIVKEGVLINPKAGANLITDEKYTDFKLLAEFRYPEGSNSGIYLRGRYEVQIEDNPGTPPSSVYFGGVYGFLTPNEMVVKSAGEWQNFEITLVGRRVTIVANGKSIICDQIIPGITGGALDSNEGEPGPIMLQGDHGEVEFRKITIIPAR
ncbi:3-keto-disaccharide hydrolase [Pleomorphovibrio marinus]|uniref:3-keto-disaccharide hydrolase n=1 Tax=Pleomorphovibrio marinus TaxID=2164132 RepID=UPI000E0BD5D7|nr:DUF1080 domain-containing protein [Pleomorphovibrio marinus]